MTEEKVIEKLSEILSDILDRDVRLEKETRAADVEGWDSLTTMTFMVLIEKDLNVELTIEEISSFENIGALAAKIVSRRNDG